MDYGVQIGVSNRPATIQGGYIEKGTGQTVITEKETYANKPCTIGIPNKSDCWGIRLDRKGEIPKDENGNIIRYGATDTRYDGKIKFTKRNDPNGVPIATRYLKGYHSLDVQYQDLVLDAKNQIKDDDIDSIENFMLMLPAGNHILRENDYDHLFIENLKHHDYNGSNPDRSPQVTNWLFREVPVEVEGELKTVSLSSKADALIEVRDASKDNSGRQLKVLFDAVKGSLLLSDLSDKTEIFDLLMSVADERPEDFIQAIAAHKIGISQVIEKAKSYDILDLKKDGTIAAVDESKKVVLSTNIPAKKEAMLEWLISNFIHAEANEVIFQLTKIVDKLK